MAHMTMTQEQYRQTRQSDLLEAETAAAELKERLEHSEQRRHGPQACPLAASEHCHQLYWAPSWRTKDA